MVYTAGTMTDYSIVDLDSRDIPLLDGIKPDTWSDITAIHEHYLKCPNCECVKAVSPAGTLLGIGTAIDFGLTAWLAHIIVSGAHQRRGIGSRIVDRLVGYLRDERGCRTVTLTATDQGYPVYKKAGFADESAYVIMEKADGHAIPDGARANIRAIDERDYDEALRIDRVTSGEERSGFLLPVLKNALVYADGARVLGFYIPGFGDGGVSALTENAGIALLGERTKDCRKIFLPEENRTGYDYLVSAGYTETKRIHRMILGEPFPRKPECCYSRIGGFAG